MVLIMCTKNESNLTHMYWDMVPHWQKCGRTDRMDRLMDDAKTLSLRLRRGKKNTHTKVNRTVGYQSKLWATVQTQEVYKVTDLIKHLA